MGDIYFGANATRDGQILGKENQTTEPINTSSPQIGFGNTSVIFICLRRSRNKVEVAERSEMNHLNAFRYSIMGKCVVKTS